MRKVMFSAIGLLFALLLANPARAQHTPRGKAVDINKAEIEATVQKTASAPVSDQQIRVVSINGDYNVGVGVVHRAKTAGRDIGGGVEHSQITEVYHVISGNGTLVTGGTIQGAGTLKTVLVQNGVDDWLNRHGGIYVLAADQVAG